jgi:tetratricopeptide (TPR) repeat protein
MRLGDERAAKDLCTSAVELTEREIEARPYDFRLYSALGQSLALLGRREEAVQAGEHAVKLVPITKDAIDWSERAIELAMIYTRVGLHEKALDLIDELLSVPCELSVGLLRLDPVWDPLRDKLRFQEILAKYAKEN